MRVFYNLILFLWVKFPATRLSFNKLEWFDRLTTSGIWLFVCPDPSIISGVNAALSTHSVRPELVEGCERLKIRGFLKIFIPFLLLGSGALNAVELHPAKIIKRQKSVSAYRNKDYQQAEKLFQELLLQDHQDYEALYNLGKVSSAKKDFAQAEGYFDNVSKMETLPPENRIEAFFDKANAQVQQKKLEDALKSYEHVLKLSPEHKQAQEMVEHIKKLLEQQNQQQQNDKSDKNQDKDQKDQQQDKSDQQKDQKQDQNKDKKDQNKQQNSDQKDGEQKQDKQQQDSGDQQQNKNDQSNDEQSDQQKDKKDGKDDQKDQEKQQDQQQSSESGGKPKDRGNEESESGQKSDKLEQKEKGKEEQQGGAEDKQQDSTQDSNGQPNNEGNNESDSNEANQNENNNGQEQREHASPLENESSSDDTKEEQEKQMEAALAQDDEQEQEKPDERLDEQDALLLKLLEDKDAKTLKQLLKGTVKKDMPEQYGQKNW